MFRFSFKRLMIALSVAMLSSVGFAHAQPTPTAALMKGGEPGAPQLRMTESDFKLNKRSAIAFKGFEMKDPKTGKELKATDRITLRDGRQVVVGEYVRKLDELEASLNKMGHTLRNKSGPTVLQDAVIPQATLRTQSDALTRSLVTFNAATMKAPPSTQAVLSAHTNALKVDSKRLATLNQAVLNQGAPKTVDFVKTWNNQLGNKSLAAAFLDGKFEFHGTVDRVKASAEANAGGYLMNHKITLLTAKGSVNSPKTGNSRATLNVLVKGQSILNLDKSFPSTYNETKKLSKSFDYGTTFRFSIGPIPVSGKIGVRGSAGVDLVFAVRQLHADMHVKPHIDAKVYAQAGVDLLVASAGVGGNLTLIKDTLDIGADIGLDFDSKGAYISQHVYAHNKLEMLSGNFYIYARVDYIFDSSEWRTNIWNYAGIKTNGYLFNINKKTYLTSNGPAVNVNSGGVLSR